jgi:hypothetical protein
LFYRKLPAGSIPSIDSHWWPLVAAAATGYLALLIAQLLPNSINDILKAFELNGLRRVTNNFRIIKLDALQDTTVSK